MRSPTLTTLSVLLSSLLTPLAPAQSTSSNATPTVEVRAPELLTPHFGVQDPMSKALYVRSRTVRVDVGLLRRARPGHLVSMRMFDDADFTLRLTRIEIEPHLDDTYHWHAKIVGRPNSQVILTVHADAFAAWVWPDDARFQSLSIQGAPGTYVARELRDAMHQGSVVRSDKQHHVGPSSSCNDDKDRIDMTLVYGTGALADAGSTSKIKAAIASAVAQANLVCANSRMTTRFYAKSIRAVSYRTSGNQLTDLQRLDRTADGSMDIVHTWRRSDRADLIALFRSGSGGIAYCAPGISSVNGYSSLGSMVFAHELGHNLGAGHDPVNNTPGNRCTNRTYGLGHNFFIGQSGLTRNYAYTVMSYASGWGSCGLPFFCVKTRIPFYSSPSVKLTLFGKSFSTGTSTRDNRRTILELAQSVANRSRNQLGWTTAPVIRTDPSSRRIALGYNTQAPLMVVTATGATKYQWRFNGRAIPGQTSSVLNLPITNATKALEGSYDCVVSNPCRSTTSRSARLTVGPDRVLFSTAKAAAAVGSIGDVDGDGYRDFAIGYRNLTPSSGQVQVWSGRTHKRFVAWQYNDGRDSGASIAGADLDGDGLSDLITGAPRHALSRGMILWHPGSDIRKGQRFVKTLKVGVASGDLLGEHLAVGRFDAAANADVVSAHGDKLSAFSSRKGFPALWRVTVVRGTWITALVTVGDVDGDGYDDLGVGLSSFNNGGGRVELRSGRDGSRIRSIFFAGTLNVGHSLAAPGDVNGDDVPDIAFGAPSWSSKRGWISIRSGADLNKTITSRTGTVVNARLGQALASGADYNGDGVKDLLVSEVPVASRLGRVLVFNSRDLKAKALRIESRSSLGNATFGSQVAFFDANGDSRGDLLVSMPGSGVFLWDKTPKASPPRFAIFGRSGPGTKGHLPRIDVHLPYPRIGRYARMRLHGARANTVAICRLGFGRLNVPLDALGITGGSLLVNPIVDFVRPTSARGNAAFTLQIPNLTRHVGVAVTWQWYTIDQGGNSFGITASDAAETVIGAR